MAASWPSNSDVAVTMRTWFSGLGIDILSTSHAKVSIL
jgi:hypothetical protein